MKSLSLVLLPLLVSLQLLAQKENNVWIGGYNVGIDFGGGAPTLFERSDDQLVWRTNTAICDSLGALLFYTHGYRIFNKNFQLMANGNNLDIGDYVLMGYDLLAVQDGAVIVPVPSSPDEYYVFHVDADDVQFDTLNPFLSTHVFYCVVDMSLDGGNGAVVDGKKDVVILSDTLVNSGLKAVKHANGRDYWLLCHEAGSNRFYRFLVDPYGVHGPYAQDIGNVIDGENIINFTTLAFSQDGLKAAQSFTVSGVVDLYNFDRCTGEFLNLQSFTINDTAFGLMDIEFSPSGRYLYTTANYWNYIFQFDVTAADVYASRQLVAVFSGATNPFFTDFDKLCVAPDGKMYVSTYDGNNSLHIIHHPDSAGLACQFEENGLQISPIGSNWSSVPNTVNYSLGPLYGSGCDTVTKAYDFPIPTFTFGVYPNPFTSELQLIFTGVVTKANVHVSDVLGQTMYTGVFDPTNYAVRKTVDLSGVAAGVYFVTVDVNGQRLTRKVVKR